MDNQDDVAKSFVPSAGYINKPSSSQQDGPNKKVIIIATAIILSVMVIFAIIYAIILAVLPKDTPEKPAEPVAVEKPEEPARPKTPEKIGDTELEKELSVKANRILSYGSVQSSSVLRYVQAPVFYTEGSVSSHFARLNANDKMIIIVNFYRSNNSPALTDKEATSFGQESCQLLFKEKNCKLVKDNIAPSRYLKITQSKQKLEQKYVSIFGGNSSKFSTQLTSSCPYFTYVKEIGSYVFMKYCGTKNYNFSHFYQYSITQEGERAYVYFVGATTEANEKGKYAKLYGDLDRKNLLDNQGDYSNFEINSKNYETFQRYRLVFKKSGTKYIYENFETVKD